MTLSILRKSMSATSRNNYTEMFMISTIFMLEKMYKASIEQLSRVTIIQIWEGGPGTRMPRICKCFFHAKCDYQRMYFAPESVPMRNAYANKIATPALFRKLSESRILSILHSSTHNSADTKLLALPLPSLHNHRRTPPYSREQLALHRITPP